MKKTASILISILLLLSCMIPVTAVAETQSTTLHYSVSATVVYMDYDGTQATQKVDVGNSLKEPGHKDRVGYTFLGWKDESTGNFWNFENPIENHLTLTACYSENDSSADEVDYGEGKLIISVQVESEAADADLGVSKADFINMLIQNGDITPDEVSQITDGASMNIVLLVKAEETYTDESVKAQMEQAAQGYTVGQLFDISLYKYLTIDGQSGERQEIHETQNLIMISLRVPDSLINTDSNVERTYCVLRSHDGKTEILESTYDPDTQMLTFQTDKFSDYAIAYKDVQKSANHTDPSGINSGTNAGSNASGMTHSAPKTGDTSDVFRYGFLLVCAMAAMCIGLCRRHSKN